MKDNDLILRAALDYHRRGWTLLPIAGNKKPPRGCPWKNRWETERQTAADIHRRQDYWSRRVNGREIG
jgi:hypothetical protein